MDTKLTIKLDEHIIESAKKYAKERNTSLSKLVANYFDKISMEIFAEDFFPFIKTRIIILIAVNNKTATIIFNRLI